VCDNMLPLFHRKLLAVMSAPLIGALREARSLVGEVRLALLHFV